MVKVLVADDEPVGRELLASVLRGVGHECVLARDGHEAWDILQAPDAPQVLFLDWMMPGIDGIEICRRIREHRGADYKYIAIVSARNRQQDIVYGFESGADEFVTKPYMSEDILARIRVAERLMRSVSMYSGLPRAIAEACESASGDVIVRTDNRVGRILFHEGRIAWAHISDQPGSLHAILADEPGITRDDVKAVLDESRASGQNFTDVLVAWDLLTPARLRELLRDWIRAKVATIAAFPAPVVLFSPEKRAATGGLLFEPSEILPAELSTALDSRLLTAANGPHALGALAQPRPVVEAAGLADSLDRALTIAGAHSVAVFDLKSGRCLGRRGADLDLDLVWSQLRIATQGTLGDDFEDLLITTRGASHLVRWYTRTPPRLVFLTVDRSVPLGLARHALARCVPAEV